MESRGHALARGCGSGVSSHLIFAYAAEPCGEAAENFGRKNALGEDAERDGDAVGTGAASLEPENGFRLLARLWAFWSRQ